MLKYWQFWFGIIAALFILITLISNIDKQLAVQGNEIITIKKDVSDIKRIVAPQFGRLPTAEGNKDL